MNLKTRLLLIGFLLGTCLVFQLKLRAYFERPGPLPSVALAKPLSEFPMELGDWKGIERPMEEDQGYADEHLQRNYFHPKRQQLIALWMVYSSMGVDRGHHPEVCMVTAGKPEDRSARRTCPVEGPGDPVQQYRFGKFGDQQLVFYWHYTLPSARDESLSGAQRLYQRLRRRPSSMTIEIFAPERTADDSESAREFVQLVDAAVREIVGPNAIRSSKRLPVTLVDPARVEQK